MGHALPIVTLSVRKVIHGIRVPLVACTPMRHIQHAIEDGVTEVHVRTCHVNLGAQHHLARFHLARIHLLKKTEALLCRTVTIRRVCSCLCWSSFLLSNLFCRLLIDVGPSLLNQRNSKIPQLLEIITGIIDVAPFEAQPLNVSLDCLNILCIFLLRVCIVHAKVAHATIFLSHTKVKRYRLGMSYMQIAIRLGRKTCLHPPSVLTFGQILHQLFFNKVERLLFALFRLEFFCVFYTHVNLFLFIVFLNEFW